jgi:putative Mn2+ efflux pump MntP
MGPGIFLMVIGALLTFAIEDHVPGLDLNAAGVILMLAGAAVVARALSNEVSERTVTRSETSTDPDSPNRVVHRTVRERRPD